MNGESLDFLLTAGHWSLGDPDAFPARVLEHLGYSILALVLAFLLAFPLGLLIGHTDRGSFLAINVGNAGRALPTLGILMLVLSLVGTGLVPVIVALVVLAVPPLLTTTYAGINSVSRDAVDAARGMGMKEWQIAWQVELPIALPIVFGGIRNATLQVVSTATIAAYVGLGGLGRYLFDGLALRDYPRVLAGAVVLAVLAVTLDLLLGALQRLLVSPGVDGRALGGPRRPEQAAPGPVPAPLAAAGAAAHAPLEEDVLDPTR